MFNIHKLEKEELIEYIKKMDGVMDKKDRYIDALEERIYEQEKLNNIDAAIKDLQSSLRASIARMDMFEKRYNYKEHKEKEPVVMDLNEDKETDKVKESKFKVGDIVECSWLSGKHVVRNHWAPFYLIENIESGEENIVTYYHLSKAE